MLSSSSRCVILILSRMLLGTWTDMTAAGHGWTNFIDVEAVRLVETILASHRRAMPKLEVIDKWPNIDGFLDFQDDSFNPVGRLEVQVKGLPENHQLKYKCNVSFLLYCRDVAQLPVLLFGVDLQIKRIYWLHIDEKFASSLKLKPNQKYKTIYFENSRWFDDSNTNYINEWHLIVKANQERVKYYDDLFKTHQMLLETANIALGKRASYYISIHRFLDRFNDLLENEFSIVKRRYFPDAWKVGLAYYLYENASIAYSIYPIPLDYNDVQVKQVDRSLGERLKHEGADFRFYPENNPIEEDPDNYAMSVIHSNVKRLLEDRLLDHACSDFLASEYVYNYIFSSAKAMGTEIREEYDLDYIGELMKTGLLLEPQGFSLREIAYPFFIFHELFFYLKRKEARFVRKLYRKPLRTIQ